ncbi:1 3-beta-glucanosyltransferase gel4 [Coemansia sp. Benny D160-2]|nr:1 3-beta-glucanosyltransferase gel4 [Coemansia sp. Benny D160-2]
MRASLAVLSILGLVSQTQAIDPLVIKGSKWFNSKTGEQFFIKGVDYQPDITSTSSYLDPLADKTICTRDVPYLKDLGVNAVRVYQTEPYGNHDDCMKMLADAGIYVMLDLGTPNESIDRNSPSYDVNLLGYYQSKVDAFGGYDNILGFLAGNEVANSANNTDASAFVKGALRDIKAYVKSKGLTIPVGYAANDDADIRWQMQTYFDCGTTEEQADFYGLNIYEWCGTSATFETSGYANVVKNFTNWDVPAVLTEYGCNSVRPRTFPEIASIYGSDMDSTFSGGFVYEYVEESNNYGLVSISGSTVTKTEDYDNFKKALAAADPSGVAMKSYSPSGKQQSCPKVSASNSWQASDVLPPTPSNSTCECMMKSLYCVSKTTDVPTDTTALKQFGEDVSNIFGTVCATVSCDEVNGNGQSGTYGKYSFCNTIQRVSWVMNAWYKSQRGVDGSCDFNGFASLTKPSLSSDSSCSNVTGSTTGNPGSSSSDGSSSDGSSSGKSDDGESGLDSHTSGAAFAAKELSVGAMAVVVAAAAIF